jgi:hypothetical protein
MMIVIVADCGVDARFEYRDVINHEVTRVAFRLNIGFRRITRVGICFVQVLGPKRLCIFTGGKVANNCMLVQLKYKGPH